MLHIGNFSNARSPLKILILWKIETSSLIANSNHTIDKYKKQAFEILNI